jgi:hypothetical protein
VQTHGTMDVFEENSELSNSNHHLFLHPFSSLNTQKIKFLGPLSIQKSTIIKEDLLDLHTSSTQSFLVDCRSPLRNLPQLQLLDPASACHANGNDRKAFSFHSIYIPVPFLNRTFIFESSI